SFESRTRTWSPPMLVCTIRRRVWFSPAMKPSVACSVGPVAQVPTQCLPSFDSWAIATELKAKPAIVSTRPAPEVPLSRHFPLNVICALFISFPNREHLTYFQRPKSYRFRKGETLSDCREQSLSSVSSLSPSMKALYCRGRDHPKASKAVDWMKNIVR